jgi:hypothetical protein
MSDFRKYDPRQDAFWTGFLTGVVIGSLVVAIATIWIWL